jgi:RNase P subunit RPR2
MHTIVSLLPYSVDERKLTVIPQEYFIPAAVEDELGILHVDDGISWLMLEMERGGPVQQRIPSGQLADSIVNDFARSQLEYRYDFAQPGLFVVEGKFNSDDIKAKFPELLGKYRLIQENWFKALVERANQDFGKTGVSQLVSDLQKLAAKELGLKPNWSIDHQLKTLTCPLCATLLPANAAVCSNCKAILDPAKVADYQFAGGVNG